MKDIAELIWILIRRKIPMQVVYAKVTAVDKDKDTCDAEKLDDETPITEIQLKAIVDSTDSHIMVYPKVGSMVLIAIINNNPTDAYVASYSEVESFKLKIKDCELSIDGTEINAKVKSSTLVIKDNEIAFNEGNKGGLVIKSELVSDLEKINTFITTFKSILSVPIPEAGNGAPSSFQAALNGALSSFTNPTYSQIENTKVKH